jgi:hypothetical protein
MPRLPDELHAAVAAFAGRGSRGRDARGVGRGRFAARAAKRLTVRFGFTREDIRYAQDIRPP